MEWGIAVPEYTNQGEHHFHYRCEYLNAVGKEARLDHTDVCMASFGRQFKSDVCKEGISIAYELRPNQRTLYPLLCDKETEWWLRAVFDSEFAFKKLLLCSLDDIIETGYVKLKATPDVDFNFVCSALAFARALSDQPYSVKVAYDKHHKEGVPAEVAVVWSLIAFCCEASTNMGPERTMPAYADGHQALSPSMFIGNVAAMCYGLLPNNVSSRFGRDGLHVQYQMFWNKLEHHSFKQMCNKYRKTDEFLEALLDAYKKVGEQLC